MASCSQGSLLFLVYIRARGQAGLKLPSVTKLEAAPGCNQKLCHGKNPEFKACLEDARGHLINILSAWHRCSIEGNSFVLGILKRSVLQSTLNRYEVSSVAHLFCKSLRGMGVTFDFDSKRPYTRALSSPAHPSRLPCQSSNMFSIL